MDLFKNKKQEVSKEEIVQQQRKKTANQWIPIIDIDGITVYRRDKMIIGMLRIQPISIDLLSDKEKRRKVESLSEELNGINYDMHIFCIGRPVDLNNYLDWLQEKANQEQNYARKKLLKAYIKETSNIASSGNTVERRFYMIIKKKYEDKVEEELLTALRDLQNKLTAAELTTNICKDEELMDVYNLFAHPAQASFERTTMEYGLTTLLD